MSMFTAFRVPFPTVLLNPLPSRMLFVACEQAPGEPEPLSPPLSLCSRNSSRSPKFFSVLARSLCVGYGICG